MANSRDDLLFSKYDLSAFIRAYEVEIRTEVEGWERERILGASEADLSQYLIEKFTLDAPKLCIGSLHVESEGEASIDVTGRFGYDLRGDGTLHVPGSFVTIAIQFEGDKKLFDFQASSRTLSPPRGHVDENQVLFTIEGVGLDPKEVKQQIERSVANIDLYLTRVRADCERWNDRLPQFSEQCVSDRKKRVLSQSAFVKELGIPIKRREGPQATFATPVQRRKRPVALPSIPKDAFEPEPALPEGEYDYVMSVIDRLSITIERSPSTFSGMKEEQIRDLILVDLNGHYEGGATGETFNAEGKTDILIRENDRNVFIAECKFWSGPKGLLEAIGQILGYLTWRDTKAALIIFSRKADFSKVIEKAWSTIPKHPLFKRQLKQISETHYRYLFRQKKDEARDMFLAVTIFNIPVDDGE